MSPEVLSQYGGWAVVAVLLPAVAYLFTRLEAARARLDALQEARLVDTKEELRQRHEASVANARAWEAANGHLVAIHARLEARP